MGTERSVGVIEIGWNNERRTDTVPFTCSGHVLRSFPVCEFSATIYCRRYIPVTSHFHSHLIGKVEKTQNNVATQVK